MDTVAVFILSCEPGHSVIKKLVSIDVSEPLFVILLDVDRQTLLLVIEIRLIEGWNLRQLVNGLPLSSVDPWNLLRARPCNLLVFLDLFEQLSFGLCIVSEILRMEYLIVLLNGTLDEELDLSPVDLELDF